MSLSIREVRCKVAEWCENPPWANLPDLDEQQLTVNCDDGTLEISGGNDVQLSDLGTTTIYRLAANTSPGVNNREWHDTQPVVPISQSTTAAGRAFRLSHDFTLPTTTVSTLTNINMNDTDNTAGELDVQVLDTVITVPAGGVWIQYQGGSEGYWAIELGQCCGPLELIAELGYSDRLDNNAIVGPVFLPEGQHQWRAWNIDSGGTSSAHAARYSLDGTTFGTAVPAGVEFSLEKRPVECQTVNNCEVADFEADAWSTCPVAECLGEPLDPLPTEPSGLSEADVQALIDAQDHDDPTPATTAPLRVDCDPGTVGTSTDYARADHVHQVAPNLANPGWPVLTLAGPATETLAQNRRFRSDDRTLEFTYRMRFTADATANGWAYYQAPVLAGFQYPLIECLGVYYQTGSQDLNDTNPAPYEEQYMGGNGVTWADIARIYYLHFSATRKAENVIVWPNIKLTYRKIV